MDQIEQLKKIFTSLDHSGDGLLQLEEIQAGLLKVFGDVRGKIKVFDEIMQSLDRNCNGVIDYTEFLTAASNKEQLLSDQNLMFAFKMFDTDKNGTISKKELKSVFETSEKKDDELWNEIFNEVDLDGDGEITFEEFKRGLTSVRSK